MRVVVMPPFDREFFAGRDRLELSADTLFGLVGKLDELAPGFADLAAMRAAFAIDGVYTPDWSSGLATASEVILLPRVGGGDGLAWRKLEPFGVEIDRDLSQPLSPGEADEFRALFNAHGLLIARGQALSMERQQELCGLLGPILLREGENGYMTNEGGGPSASELNWHSDAAYTHAPFDALSLHALDVVDGASSTRFASAEIALPSSLKAALEDREQEMIAPHYTVLAEVTCDQRDPPAQKRGVMPAMYTNPHNGRACVWVNAMQTARLLGMEWEDSRGVLHEVYDCLYAPANVYEHRWRNGDIVIWDNIALQHMRGNIEDCGKRLLQRVIVGTEGVAPHVN